MRVWLGKARSAAAALLSESLQQRHGRRVHIRKRIESHELAPRFETKRERIRALQVDRGMLAGGHARVGNIVLYNDIVITEIIGVSVFGDPQVHDAIGLREPPDGIQSSIGNHEALRKPVGGRDKRGRPIELEIRGEFDGCELGDRDGVRGDRCVLQETCGCSGSSREKLDVHGETGRGGRGRDAGKVVQAIKGNVGAV